MAEENTPPVDKAAAAAGAVTDDLDQSTNQEGAPVPAAPPKTKAEAEAQAKEKEGQAPEPTDEEKAAAEAKAKEEADAAAAEDDDDTKDDKPLDNAVWGSTGDEVGDSVLELIQNAGMTTDEAKSIMFDAVRAGDVSKIDVAALEEKVGKARANLIMAGTRDFITRSKAKADAVVKEVHTTVGGEDNWSAITAWAKDNVPAAEIGEYQEMIDAGGAKARFAASELASRFNGDGSNTTLNAATTEIEGDGVAKQQTEALTRAQYVERMKEAHNTGATDAAINTIKAARARGRAQGI